MTTLADTSPSIGTLLLKAPILATVGLSAAD